ncbi:hypothetical protein B0A50_05013 [Salinomyces thailandicus]|uniref:Uncharacterized protein n=1 Tax=Salinomyces thailandicus TaxID=706561 RepID=A0A4U0TY17_9PEZI|nr:hypothetical protein B0A50_05013 [Salinomyces thailandica]
MAPKKGSKKGPSKASAPAAKTEAKQENAPNEQKEEEEKPMTNAKAGDKRKKATTTTDSPQKEPRRSGRGAPKAQPSQQQLLNFMLSTAAEDLCRPDDETADIQTRGNIRTYSSSVLNPFEELLSAVILSRPISHRLGLRSIRTVLNDPYNFTNAQAVKDAGDEKHVKAMWDARTQHKEKTAGEIGQIADVVLSKFTGENDSEGTKLERVRTECNRDVEKEREMLKNNIKGLGKTGLDIFFRRVQWVWDAGFPFIDGRTAQSLHKLGLPDQGEELSKLIEQHWVNLETKHLAGDDDAGKKRRALVTVLERATGSDLEGKNEALLEAAAAA